jgi:GT2 family glycosyltransferase
MGYQVLQNIVLSQSDFAPQEVFYKSEKSFPAKKGLVLDQDGTLDFFSYFNMFSWDKWQEYTGIDSLSLVLDLAGSCEVAIRCLDSSGKVQGESVTLLQTGGSTLLDVPDGMCTGHIGFSIRAKSPVCLKSAYWGTSSGNFRRDIRTAAVFCSFNRDEYLYPNLKVIRNEELNNLDVFVVDNASRIDENGIREISENFYLFHNPNTGGSGGFTRGILEAVKSSRGYTHVLLMDDDIRLNGETLFRAQALISLLKPEYQKHFLSGAMLQLDKPQMMFESTARWNGFRVKNYKKDLDITQVKNICLADKDEKRDNCYAAWWFCGIPLSGGIENDLPFPFFIYGDDMDYSFKRAPGLLTMNGIAVWHEPFAKKFSPLFKSYFFCRNTLILNSLHSRKFNYFHNTLNSAAHFFVQLFVHDYRSASLALDAVEDYLEGAEYVTALDEQDILKCKSLPTDFKARSENELKGTYPIQANFRRWFSPWYFFHRKLAVYDYEQSGAEIRIRSVRKILTLLNRYFKLRFLFILRYPRVSSGYRKLERDGQFWHDRLCMLEGA